MTDEHTVHACPECDSTPVYPRESKTPTWKCSRCKATFDTPTTRPTRPNRTPHISLSDLTDDIQRVADTLGRTPTRKEYDAEGRYSSSTVCRRFGSWTAGVEASGLEPRPRRRVSPLEGLSPEDLGLSPMGERA